MGSAFWIVLFAVVGVAIVAAVYALATSGRFLEEIGRGGTEVEAPRPDTGAEEVEEIRQMLRAQNEHRIARGEPPIDVEAETERLLREM
jgi:hypothetical protein